jgi:steroid 5-alpha reductase family enzyme
MELLITALAASLGINLGMFVIAYKQQSDKLTDISYAVSFATIALFGLSQVENPGVYHYVATGLVLVWALRLGGFLLYRVVKKGKDVRFDEIRNNFKRFLNFWVTQAVTAWLLMLPVLFAFSQDDHFKTWSFVGAALWAIGFVIESTADFQKYRFSLKPSNKNKWIDEGIWHYSRHPNYFGEITVWVGMYIFALSNLPATLAVVSLISPLFIALLLLRISGLPPLETSADKRWGSNPAYQAYKKRTSIVVPLPHKG